MEVNRYKYSEMIITDYNFLVPLDYENEDGEKISIFAREILREEYENKHLPYLIFFQGGPGYESPRPITDSGWIKRASEEYRQDVSQSLVRDLDAVLEKLNTTFQEELKQEIEAKAFFME